MRSKGKPTKPERKSEPMNRKTHETSTAARVLGYRAYLVALPPCGDEGFESLFYARREDAERLKTILPSADRDPGVVVTLDDGSRWECLRDMNGAADHLEVQDVVIEYQPEPNLHTSFETYAERITP